MERASLASTVVKRMSNLRTEGESKVDPALPGATGDKPDDTEMEDPDSALPESGLNPHNMEVEGKESADSDPNASTGEVAVGSVAREGDGDDDAPKPDDRVEVTSEDEEILEHPEGFSYSDDKFDDLEALRFNAIVPRDKRGTVPFVDMTRKEDIDIESIFLHVPKNTFFARYKGEKETYYRFNSWPPKTWFQGLRLMERYNQWYNETSTYGLEVATRLHLPAHVHASTVKAIDWAMKERILRKPEDVDSSREANIGYWMEKLIPRKFWSKKGVEKDYPPTFDKGPKQSTSSGNGGKEDDAGSAHGEESSTGGDLTARLFEAKEHDFEAAMDKAKVRLQVVEKQLKVIEKKHHVAMGYTSALRVTSRLSEPLLHGLVCVVCGSEEHMEDKCTVREEASVQPSPVAATAGRRSIKEILAAKKAANKTAAIKCSYELCGQEDHHLVAACPVLHNRCTACGHRGHGPDTKYGRFSVCLAAPDTARTADLDAGALGAIFEETADSGVYTRHRKQIISFGFFPVRNGTEAMLMEHIGYDALASAENVHIAFEQIQAVLRHTFASDKRFTANPKSDQKLYDERVLEHADLLRQQEALRKEIVKISFDARETYQVMASKTQATMAKELIKARDLAQDNFRAAYQAAVKEVFARPIRRITGREPVTSDEDLETVFGKSIVAKFRGKPKKATSTTPPPPTGTAPSSTAAPSFAGIVMGPSVSEAAGMPFVKPTKRSHPATKRSDSARDFSPAPSTSSVGPSSDKRPRDSRTGVNMALINKCVASYGEVRKFFLNQTDKQPAKADVKRVTMSEVREMMSKPRLIMDTILDKPYYQVKKGDFKDLSIAEVMSFPKNVTHWPDMTDRQVWGHTGLTDRDVVLVCGRHWFVRQKQGGLYKWVERDPSKKAAGPPKKPSGKGGSGAKNKGTGKRSQPKN